MGLCMKRVLKCAYTYDCECLHMTLCGCQDVKIQLTTTNVFPCVCCLPLSFILLPKEATKKTIVHKVTMSFKTLFEDEKKKQKEEEKKRGKREREKKKKKNA